MLSYRHEFHAGNFADVLKHLVLVRTLEHLLKKPSPILYIDTHAGEGLYNIRSASQEKTGEYNAGFEKLDFSALPEACSSYKSIVDFFLPRNRYPGSPCIATKMLRKCDQCRFYELHPQDVKHLETTLRNMKGISPWKVEQSDGFASLKALLPAKNKRAIVLVDPPYELKSDYDSAVKAVTQAYHLMPNALFFIWYPVVAREHIDRMIYLLRKSKMRDVWQFEFGVRADDTNYGMTASGVFAINPPWTLASELKDVLPKIQAQISADEGFHLVQNLIEE